MKNSEISNVGNSCGWSWWNSRKDKFSVLDDYVYHDDINWFLSSDLNIIN